MLFLDCLERTNVLKSDYLFRFTETREQDQIKSFFQHFCFKLVLEYLNISTLLQA